MNVDELQRLAAWYASEFKATNRLYSELQDPLNHNASQADKRPIQEPLDALTDFLADQRFDELSLQQLKLLSSLGVDAYMGPAGAEFVNSVVRTANYDPATAVQQINEAIRVLNNTRGSLKAYDDAVAALGFQIGDVQADEDHIIIRIGFQNDVSINNITDWKNTGKEWWEIVRGVAMACGEKPEDVKVIGAATGSVILVLAATAGFTALLARISKHITGVAKEILELQHSKEDLRQKKILTQAMALEFERLEQEHKDGAVTTVQALLGDTLKGKTGDIETGLKKSVEKLLTFSEKGGSVDFVAPEEGEEEDNDSGELKTALIEAREAIRDYQGERESLKLLTHGTGHQH